MTAKSKIPRQNLCLDPFMEASLFMGWGQEITGGGVKSERRKKGVNMQIYYEQKACNNLLLLVNFFSKLSSNTFFCVLGQFGHLFVLGRVKNFWRIARGGLDR